MVRRLELIVGIVVIMLSAGAGVVTGCARQPIRSDRAVLVLDFQDNVNSSETPELSRTLAELMMTNLDNHPRIIVRERRSLPLNDPQATWFTLGRQANADYVIVGSISRLDENYVVNARLLSLATAQIVKGSSVTRSCRRTEDLYPLMEAMSRIMASHLKVLADRFEAMGQQAGAGAPTQ